MKERKLKCHPCQETSSVLNQEDGCQVIRFLRLLLILLKLSAKEVIISAVHTCVLSIIQRLKPHMEREKQKMTTVKYKIWFVFQLGIF